MDKYAKIFYDVAHSYLVSGRDQETARLYFYEYPLEDLQIVQSMPGLNQGLDKTTYNEVKSALDLIISLKMKEEKKEEKPKVI